MKKESLIGLSPDKALTTKMNCHFSLLSVRYLNNLIKTPFELKNTFGKYILKNGKTQGSLSNLFFMSNQRKDT